MGWRGAGKGGRGERVLPSYGQADPQLVRAGEGR